MNPARQITLQYLAAPPDGLWRWAEDGKVLTWHDGSTIAFKEEIHLILERLAPGGFPPFGAIVFLLAACRGKLATVEQLMTDPSGQLSPAAGTNAVTIMTARLQRVAQLEAALEELQRLRNFPAELISGVKAKCVLAEAIFESARAERHIPARDVLTGIKEPLTDADLINFEPAALVSNNIRQIHLVAEGLKRHTTEGLSMRLRTGLEELPNAADLELPPAERAQRLIEQLCRDPEHGAMARAALDIMAAIRLPRRLVERDYVAVGCVADIANRGPLDRLLLSELAHDDLTLSVRVALNEALYLRREPPMREPPGTLALLLDSGIRMWGVPRIFALAVSLAFIARETRQAGVVSLRGCNGRLTPVDLLSRKGLADHLASLEVESHPGAALESFANSLPPGEHHSILVTHLDTLDDDEFRRALAAVEHPPEFIAAVDAAGNFELHEVPLNRRHPICRAQLDLGTLFKQPSPSVKALKKNLPPDLPAIFGIEPFPLLLPMPGRIDRWKRGEDDFIYAMMRDRRLVKFRDASKGTQSLAWDLPGGKTLWLDHFDGKVYAVKTGDVQRPSRLIVVDAAGGLPRVHELGGGPEIIAVHRYGEVILAIRTHDVRAFSLADGRLLDQIRNPHRWVSGRFLRGHVYHYFAAWDGEAIKFQNVTFPKSIRASVISVFDRERTSGPWCLLSNGSIVSLDGSESIQAFSMQFSKRQLESIKISRDGHRLICSPGPKPDILLIDLQKNSEKSSIASIQDLDPEPPRPWRNLYRVIESVAVSGKTLLIEGRRNNWLEFIFNSEIVLRQRTTAENFQRFKCDFSEPPKKTAFGCTLQITRWKSGSIAFLDSRGLLHLKSSDPSIPEITLALDAPGVAGWTSDGCQCGPSYYFAEDIDSQPDEVFARIERFIQAL